MQVEQPQERWYQLIEEMHSSGKSQRIWCDENGVSYRSMRKWIKFFFAIGYASKKQREASKIVAKKVYLICGYTDMRKQINGLVAIAQNDFLPESFEKALFVFCGKSRDKIKILEWDGNNFWMYFKRLERGRFKWPPNSEYSMILITEEELWQLLDNPKFGIKLSNCEFKERLAS
ncbi:hypothetical protein FACS189465_0810 [Clostridia bacterium]|nr:hypothetical protein FACS189465_0810 [Clostridia bacterium]